jgi:hypothetical protein
MVSSLHGVRDLSLDSLSIWLRSAFFVLSLHGVRGIRTVETIFERVNAKTVSSLRFVQRLIRFKMSNRIGLHFSFQKCTLRVR